MASANSVQQQQQQQQQQQTFQQQGSNTYHCKDCGIYLNSAESLEVHLQYHKENLLNKWATQATAPAHAAEETNNNTAKTGVKREFATAGGSSVSAADSSDSMHKKSPEYVGASRSTPEAGGGTGGVVFGHPPTPQSYQSASSPYQGAEAAFSPNFTGFSQVKVEPTSPVSHYQTYGFQEAQFFAMEQQQQQHQQHQQQQQQYAQEYAGGVQKFRYHPYGGYERPQVVASSVSPAYPPQPTPSPSPKQCDKCGFVCDSAAQLIDHLNLAHPPTPAPHLVAAYPGFMFGAVDHHQHHHHQQQPPAVQLKTEDAQSDILDLDSHKVHQVYPEDEKRQNGDAGVGAGGGHPHSVSAMLGSWQQHGQQQQQAHGQHQKLFQQDHGKMFQPEQKMFQAHQLHAGQEYMGNGVATPAQEAIGNGMAQMLSQQPPSAQQQQQPYRPFEHLPPAQPSPTIISSSQASGAAPPGGGGAAPTGTKSANWKSNEARRPKTYNCTACNKWFTSSGHLKRHYNTTLHKNAVKSSGQPDPAALPISAHHHPAREAVARDDSSGSPGEEVRPDDPASAVAAPPFERGLLQQPPNGPYDRPPAPNIHHAPPLHSPMGGGLPNGGSPNNGDAGADQRGGGLLGFGMMPPVVEGAQFQMYPNELAPHVTQAMDISSLSTTGDFHQEQLTSTEPQQPLPSFAQFHIPRMGVLAGPADEANVGGGGAATAPSYATSTTTTHFFTDQYVLAEVRDLLSADDEECARLTAAYVHAEEEQQHMINAAQSQHQLALVFPPSPSLGLRAHNNNNDSDGTLDLNLDDSLLSECDGKEQLQLQLHHQQQEQQQQQARAAPGRRGRPKRDYEELSGSVVSSTVLGGQQHKCFECDKKFNKPCYLTQHNKTFHSGDKPFKCQTCGKRFSTEPEYDEHLKKHNGEKPHKCEQCPKQFNHKTDLRRHMCLHTGLKPYTCDTCTKGFIRKDHMLKHCETHLKKNKRA